MRDALKEGGELHKEGATWDPPDDCPVSALTSETLPPLLLDLSSQYMRIQMVVEEVIGSGFVMPHLHAEERRIPGIAFEAHIIKDKHRDVADHRSNASRCQSA